MSTSNSQLAYQEAAVHNAGPIDLVIMLYDILARDLQRAIAAMEGGKIELRTKHLKHGFLVLQELEGTLDLERGGAFEANMSRFYSMMRKEMMRAQIQQDASVLREVIQMLFSVREAWVEVKTKESQSAMPPSRPRSASSYSEPEVRSASWNG